MFPLDLTHRRRGERKTPRTVPAIVEGLERRDLLTYSPLGFSLADLTVTGTAAPVAAYQGPFTVTVDVSNLGATSIIDPLHLEPNSGSTADSEPTQVTVFMSRRSRFGAGAVPIGTIDVPSIGQNSTVELTQTFTLPQRVPGLPREGGTAYVFFQVDQARGVRDINRFNNVTRTGSAVQIAAPLPDLFTIGLDVPPVMQPGDSIQPEVKIANFGTVDPSLQGPFTVAIVASLDDQFGPGDTVLTTFTVDSLTPLSQVPSRNTVLGDVNIDNPPNVLTLESPIITLPTTPAQYFLGVIIDPLNQISELSEVGNGTSSQLDLVQPVGPPIPSLPPAGVIQSPAPSSNVFPIPPFGPIQLQTNPSVISSTMSRSTVLSASTQSVLTQALGKALSRHQGISLPTRWSRFLKPGSARSFGG